jgi:ligand-binding SRPBCC domain-containing protein
MIQRLEFADWVPFPAAQVFKFFSNPENLLRLMPPETQTRIDRLQRIEAPLSPDEGVASAQQAAGVGTVIVTSFRLLPFLPARGRWIARITEFEWNHHFADVQQKGPFRRWHHRHEFLSEARDGISGRLSAMQLSMRWDSGHWGRSRTHSSSNASSATSSPTVKKYFPSFLCE